MMRWRQMLTLVPVLVLTIALTFTARRPNAGLAPSKTVSAATPISMGEITVEADRLENRLAENEILWLARCIYSETKKPHEQELVAWVIRNRVDTHYRGNLSYRDTVLDPWQFSAFNPNNPQRRFFVNLNARSTASGWQSALRVAEKVALSDSTARPFPETTRHFFSARSMRGGRKPAWTSHGNLVAVNQRIDPHRFRFYADVS